MKTHAEKALENRNQSVANEMGRNKRYRSSALEFIDNRTEPVTQRKFQGMANDHILNNSFGPVVSRPEVIAQMKLQKKANASGQAIQRFGEQEAMDSANVGRNRVRRGNRRLSIVSSNGRSFMRLVGIHGNGIEVKGLRELMGAVRWKVIDWLVRQRGYNVNDAKTEVRQWWPAIEAEGVKHFRVGNCGEFASSVLTHIKENTRGQFVHKACMIPPPYDHALVLTAPNELRNGEAADITQVMVADAWHDELAITLQEFLNGNNPYGAQLTVENLKIEAGYWCDGAQIVPDELAQVIRDLLFDGWKNLELAMKNPQALAVASQNANDASDEGYIFDF